MGSAFRHAGVSEQAGAASKRLADARALLLRGAPHTRGAMYLAGYAIECRIKAKAMERYGCSTLDELRTKRSLVQNQVFSHRLEQLLVDLLPDGTLGRLQAAGTQSRTAWVVANRWSPQWRYVSVNADEQTALGFVNHVEVVYNWLGKNV